MEDYKKRLAEILAETGALFFDRGLVLKDGRPSPYFVNFGMFRTGRLSMELGSYFADMIVAEGLVNKTDIILGPSYKGSAIALATSISYSIIHSLSASIVSGFKLMSPEHTGQYSLLITSAGITSSLKLKLALLLPHLHVIL